MAAICCLSCHRRSLPSSPYCPLCGQRLWPATVSGIPASRTAATARFLPLGPEVALAERKQLYFLPTAEFLRALIRLFRHLGVKGVLEVGAGEGFMAGALAERGFPVVATDLEATPATPYGVPVHRASHLEAVAAWRPELAFWCWPPLGSRAPQELLQTPGLKYYLDVGDGGAAAGAPNLVPRFRGRYLHTLSRLGYSRLDWGPFRHNRCFLFRGIG